MTQEHAEKVLAFIESQCKAKVEKAIKETLGVKVNLKFEIAKLYNGDNYIKATDTLDDVDAKMRNNAILKQLFDKVELRMDVWANDPDERMGVVFNIAVSYKHNFHGGFNGHDLMVYSITESGEERIIK
ncbi:MAG: hypothetical protein J6Q39_07580 [Bacteroidales bacterium]|nr:hypothetical protein [Bacteroidales bacterium]